MNTLTQRKISLRVLLFVAAVTLIVYFLPRTDKDHYIYEVNRPWSYALLTAPFDIPVHLDSASMALVKDSIDMHFEPVYVRDLAAEKTLISDYTMRLNSTPGLNITPAQKNQIIKAIREVYDNGIVDRDTYQRIAAGNLPSVRFVHDNVAISMPTRNYLSAFRAYEHMDSVLRDRDVRAALTATRLSDMLQPNISLDTLTSKRLIDEAYQKAMAPIGVIQQGERIIDKGDIVNTRLATILDTYEEMIEDRGQGTISQHHYPVAGQILYMLILFGALYGYLFFFRPKYFDDDRTVVFLMSLVTVFTLFAFAMQATFRMGLYIAPFTMIPILVLVFLDSRTAYFVHLVEVLTCAIISAYPSEFIYLQFIAGVVAIDSLKDLTSRSQLIRTAAFIFVAYSLSYVSIEVMQTGTLNKMEGRTFGCFGINAILISFSYVLMFLVERVFGYTSRVTLVELSDTNSPLLRELSEECPGTFNHSMAVSNLASAAAQAIGANVQMVRTGALYHDIGKIKNPAFFTENQHGINPHDSLDPIQSSRVVTGHVRDGLAMAEKAKLPEKIREFITEHHGAGKARYFYNTYCNLHPGEEVDPAPFTYPGPNPQSKETSLLMMADAVEAASRSLKEHTPEAISGLVNKIIDGQIAEGLHNESPISFRDVQAVKESFIQRLRTMYHSRISYPELKK
ncbi:HD family phosphohydrolase [uncultured Duncaniella sp.]|uniref:HD family phosphohydrolase n=1 Tax=uncultured Duncaniella sp. TaxID=2768039 RepID=UPI002675B1FF|nr:HDIG domain-containing metalloprotein [uncultured Duncaniella sp.]MCI9171598.1 HDIG domain-containing protein [Muribaculaceae bacterium]